MKKISTKQKRINIRLTKKRFLKKIARKRKEYMGLSNIIYNATTPHHKRIYTDIIVPEDMCLEKHYKKTALLLRELRSTAMTTMHPVRLRLEDCRTITPPAMLLLLAEVHRARLLRGDKSVTGTYPKDERLLKRMCQTGFFDLLGIRSPISSNKTFPMEYIKFKTGNKLKAKSARELRESLLGDRITLETKARNQLQRGVTEAMLNALEHAYPYNDARSLPVKDQWWLTGHYHRPTDKLSVMFCDLGVGIPTTLPRNHSIEIIREVLAILPGIKPKDGQMILAGMKVGRTSTKKPHRGKGLNDLRQFVDHAGDGELKIYSRAGEYRYRSLNKEDAKTNSVMINGTLIIWTVPLKNVTKALEKQHE